MSSTLTPSDQTVTKTQLFGLTPARFAARYGALLGLIVLAIVLSLMSPVFLDGRNLTNIVSSAAANAPLAVGMLLVIITGGIDLSVGAILAVSMSLMATMVSKGDGTSPLIVVVACLAMGTLWGWINGILVTKLCLPHPFISTLGTMYIARGLAWIIGGTSTIILPAESGLSFQIAPYIVIILCVIFQILLSRTSLGRHIYAVGGNTEAARMSGINVSRTLIIVYGLSGLMAGLAALFQAGRLLAFIPTIGTGSEIDAIAAVIIGGASLSGGVGTIAGTVIGVLIIAMLRNGLALLNASNDWQTLMIGLVIISALFIDLLRRRARE